MDDEVFKKANTSEAVNVFGRPASRRTQSGGDYAKVGPSDSSDDDDDTVPVSSPDDGIVRVSDSHETRNSNSCWIRLVILLSLLLLASLGALWTIALRISTEPCPSAAVSGNNTSSTPHASVITDDTVMDSSWNNVRLPFVSGLKGAVASDHETCSELAAHTILRDGHGNAVDAAIVTALCLGVVNPASSGLGGGAFMLLYHTPRNGRTTRVAQVLECRERAPRGASTNLYQGYPSHASVRGGLAIPILGELHCLVAAHARYGRMAWSHLVQPVVDLATRGVVVGPYLAHQIADVAALYRPHERDDGNATTPTGGDNATQTYVRTMRRLLTLHDDWNTPLVEGSLYRNPALAATLQAIAVHGSSALYMDRADALAHEIQQAGGIVTADDIRSFPPATAYPPLVSRHVNGYTLVGVPPPSSGGAAILGAVRFLSGFAAPLASRRDTLSMHRIVEACKHVFALRLSLSDPLYQAETVAAAVHDLVSGTYMDTLRRRQYQDNTTLPMSQYGGKKWSQLHDDDGTDVNATDAKEGDRQRHHRQVKAGTKRPRTMQRSFGYLEDHGTSHFSVVDEEGNAVAMTTSVNTNFGSHVWSESTGILFSNTMDDFSKPDLPNHYGLRPAESNYIQPGKRPLSSMSPTLVFRERITGDAMLDADMDDDTWLHTGTDLVLAIGASGGPKIITSVLQVLLRTIYMGQSLWEAVQSPRLHDQLMYHGSSVTAAEHATLVVPTVHSTSTTAVHDNGTHSILISVLPLTRAALIQRRHRMIDIDFSGTVQAVAVDLETNQRSAVSDPRKGGVPAGY